MGVHGPVSSLWIITYLIFLHSIVLYHLFLLSDVTSLKFLCCDFQMIEQVLNPFPCTVAVQLPPLADKTTTAKNVSQILLSLKMKSSQNSQNNLYLMTLS
jgi:hypothetical protein